MKKAAAFCLLLTLIISIFSGCGSSQGETTTTSVTSLESTTEPEVSAAIPESVADITAASADNAEMNAVTVSEAKSSGASTTITLSGSSASFSGTGVKISGSTVTINKSGTYILSGELNGGQIVVTCNGGEVVLLLNGTKITSKNGPALYISDAKKVVLTLAEGTQNTLADSTNYAGFTNDANKPNAALFCQSDLTINGKGSLKITGNYNNAVNCRDILKIINCTLDLTSVDDGVIGKDAVIIENTSITANTEGDGVKATNADDTSLGYLSVKNSKITLTAGTDGLQAETNLYIAGGTLNITTGGGSQNASTKADGSENPGWGAGGDSASSDDSADDTESAKGIKAASFVRISSGNITLDTSDDSIHSNNAVQILGGTLKLSSGDDGVHADTKLEIKSGTIAIAKSYEGLESTVIGIAGGKITVEANDDGVNISGGADSSAMGGRPGENNFSTDSTGDSYLDISGGSIYVNSGGDGLDANGGITMSGGTVVVDGPTNDGNGALDYDTSFIISGGTFVVIGSSGMAQSPSTSSTQYSIAAGFSSAQSAGTVICLTDSAGNKILTVKARKQFAHVVISSPNLKKGTKYTVSYGGTVSSSADYGLITDNSYSGGKSLGSANVSSAVTTIGTTGGGFGGGGFGGGGRP